MSEERPPWVPWGAVEDAMAHAAREAREGRESCGLIFGGGHRRCRNLAPDPSAGFLLPPGDVLEVSRMGLPWAVVHSHPHPLHACPSAADMRQQLASGRPWAIVPVGEGGEPQEPFWWGPEVLPRPLLGRPFRHGVTDCYALVRDWWSFARCVELPDHPREWNWWEAGAEGPNLYETHFAAAGFVEIAPSKAGVGDCLLLQVRSRVPNHAAVIVEPGLIMHHPGGDRPHDPGRLSKRDVLGRWTPHVARALRLERPP